MCANNCLSEKRSVVLILSFVLLLAAAPSHSFAAGSLVVTPTRIAFDNRTRSAQVTILNTGSDVASYRATFVRRHMLEDGNLIEVKEGEKGNFSDELIRYSPRQVTLPPGQSQVIRLLLRKPRDLPIGEYRSHMLFQALPEPKKFDRTKAKKENPNAIIISITPLIGITIPIIVRHGELHATFSLEDPEFLLPDKKFPTPRLAVSMIRSGTRSVYGDFKVTYTPEGQSNSTIVSQVKGVAVYTPNTTRRFTLRLENPPGISFDKGDFDIVFNEREKKVKSPQNSIISLTIP